MKTVLVTGGCGCLGSWVIKLLIEKKDKVICLDTSSNINRLKLILDEKYLKKFLSIISILLTFKTLINL